MDTLQHKKYKILLVGDSCVDEYQIVRTDRISPEAPVPIFTKVDSFARLGMANNVKNNLMRFGCDITFFTKSQSRKIRLIDQKTERHILRLDNDIIETPFTIEEMPDDVFDGIVISDYGKGSITSEFVIQLKNKYKVPVFVDTKKQDLASFEGCIVKVNEDEFKNATSYCTDLIITLGSKGAKYKDQIYPGVKVTVHDVCGAGDTFLAALAYFTILSGKLELAIPLANKAAAVTVQHLGTYSPKLEEFI